MSQEQAISQPPPRAKPSTIAMVGLVRFQIASTALSVNLLRMLSTSAPMNSVMSAPATKAWGLARLPSGGGFGGAPVTTKTRTLSCSSIQAQTALMDAITSLFKAFSLSGRLIVMQAKCPSSFSSSMG